MDRIDFRSDTVTWPTPAMREAMATAVVGDDVYGEDPTVNRLEAMAAERVGKEAGLFVASGTMGNLAALLAHATRGDEAILGVDAHIYCWEAGSMAALGGIIPHPLPTDALGRMSVPAVEDSIRDDDPHLPRTRLILMENSYGARNGAPVPLDYMGELAEVARRHGLVTHLDGARLFNAAVALNVPAATIAAHVDSVSFCLSKGLCAPVGSVLCGSQAFIGRARRMRKALGGGMRQAGVLAAAGIVALEEMIARLHRDHEHAKLLARGLADVPGILLDPETVHTNIIYFDLGPEVPITAPQVARRLREEVRVWIGAESERRFRVLTHYWVGPNEINILLSGLREIMRQPDSGV
jgi:threonine aldolase